MKKIYLLAFVMSMPVLAMAQNVEVPMFDDDMPKLGRKAEPLDHIIFTPSELPEVRVDIDDTRKTPIKPKMPEDVKKEVAQKVDEEEDEEEVNIKEGAPKSKPISFKEAYSESKSQELNEQLNEGILHYQQEKAKAELERKIAEEREKAAKEKEKQAKLDQKNKGAEAGVPDSIKDLFAKTADVHTFDISGVELGMTPDEVVEQAQDHGYRITKVEHGIPLHRTSYYNAVCRGAQIRRLDAVQNCIIDQAKEDEVYYVSSITFVKDITAEYMQVLFSTRATDNVSYKIYYENKGDNSLNFTRKNLAKKLRRRDAFMKMLYETYGAPDDKDQLIWGEIDKSYMKAQLQGSSYNAYLVLEDKEIPVEDWVDADDRKEELKYRHNFTFGVDPDADGE